MLRNASVQVLCGLIVLCLFAPAVSHAGETPGQAPSRVESIAQEAPPVAAPAGGSAVCPLANPAVAPLFQQPRPVVNCTAIPCNGTTNCTKLCGDIAFCNRRIGSQNGFCDFE